jgi:hypothetical protein
MSDADRLAQIIKRKPHSFRAIREKTTLDLTDEQFARLVTENPNRFKIVQFANKNDRGERVMPNRPGVKLIAR